jgi:hypothetical protein
LAGARALTGSIEGLVLGSGITPADVPRAILPSRWPSFDSVQISAIDGDCKENGVVGWAHYRKRTGRRARQRIRGNIVAGRGAESGSRFRTLAEAIAASAKQANLAFDGRDVSGLQPDVGKIGRAHCPQMGNSGCGAIAGANGLAPGGTALQQREERHGGFSFAVEPDAPPAAQYMAVRPVQP